MKKTAERRKERRVGRGGERGRIKRERREKSKTRRENNRARRKQMDNRVFMIIAIKAFGNINNTSIVDVADMTRSGKSVVNKLKKEETEERGNFSRAN